MISTLSKKHSFDAVFDSQKVFRLILEAMSNPARVVNIKEYADKLFGRHPALLTVAMTLMDNEVSFCTCENQSLSDEIASLTLGKREQIESADFIFVCDPNDIKNAIENAKRGTLPDPHKSATIVIRDDGVPACPLTLSGPGMDGDTTVRVTQTVKDVITLRDAQYYEYPQGIDLIFISNEGGLIAIPRTSHMEAE
jgi:alpha-D-ribose 1-methylphosphonate 5-triphosphate synthase subunit PhnH